MEWNARQATSLRKLYFVRTVFQVLWATGVFTTFKTHPAIAATLLILYPLWDVACTAYDLRTSALDKGTRTSQTINAVLGTAAALGIALTTYSEPVYALGTFGAWAFGAGLLQLVAGLLRRRQTGGQWAMILSGLQSMAAGVTLGLGGIRGTVHANQLGGYAIFGAFYFAIAGILLSRKLSRLTEVEAIG